MRRGMATTPRIYMQNNSMSEFNSTLFRRSLHDIFLVDVLSDHHTISIHRVADQIKRHHWIILLMMRLTVVSDLPQKKRR